MSGSDWGSPVPSWNRNQGTTDAREAALAQSEDLRADVALRVRTEVSDALQAYTSATKEARELEASVLAPARENRGLLEESYRAGKIDLPSLLLLRDQLLDAVLAYWDAWLARRQAWARLRAALGDPAPDPGETP
ncbi:MAG: TolC family protein [Gemmatimonadota bacterium]|nr:TolC family protein [Gemmatimonadota bacterium]